MCHDVKSIDLQFALYSGDNLCGWNHLSVAELLATAAHDHKTILTDLLTFIPCFSLFRIYEFNKLFFEK